MSLRIIAGRAGSGKSAHCLTEIREQLAMSPLGSPLIYMVPPQMSFQAEQTLAGQQGMMRAQVLSFRRLAWNVLREAGGLARTHIDSTGIRMALRRILANHAGELKVFGRAASRAGFVEQLEGMYCELMRYNVGAADLEARRTALMEAVEQTEGAGFLPDKLHDMQLIFGELEQMLAGRYLDSEHYLPLLASRLPDVRALEGAEVWIDGFETFTPQEMLVIAALLRTVNRVTITLPLDRIYGETDGPNELDLFYTPAVAYERLVRLARESGVRVEDSVLLSPATSPRYLRNPALAHIEAHWSERPASPYEGEASTIMLRTAANRCAEVDAAARRIVALVREEGYRFRDIAVVVRNFDAYENVFTTVFADYELPFFLDEKRPMMHHPLTELIRSALEAVRYGWKYDAVFRCVKTDLLLVPQETEELTTLRHSLDRLENYVLAHGIEGYRWTQSDSWTYRIYRGLDAEMEESDQSTEEKRMESELDDLRHRVADPLSRLETDLGKAKTVRAMCEALYNFLLACEIPDRLETWSEEARLAGQPEQAREHGQVWQAIITLMDQLVEVLGDEKLTLDLFADVVDAGLEDLTFSLVPPSLDQVLVGQLERSRFANMPCVFVLGMNDGVIPARPPESGMLSDAEREVLTATGIELAPSGRRRILDEELMLYRALASPSERLWVSCPLADEEGKALLPAPALKRFAEMIPGADQAFAADEPGDVPESEQLSFVTGPGRALSRLIGLLGQWNKGYALAPLWWDVYNVLYERNQDELRLLTRGLFYRNEEARLPARITKRLYGETIRASVSRMEKYKSCPFSHFATYGLKLKERELYRLEAPDIGQLFHAALKMVGDRLVEQKREWSSLEADQAHALAKEMVAELTPKLQKNILLSSRRNEYLSHKLTNVVGRAAAVLAAQARRSAFTPRALEVAFGMGDGGLPALEVELADGTRMQLVGRIDRVDGADGPGGLLLRVLDYKSSAKGLALEDVYFGLSLQMLVYLDVVLENAEAFFGQSAEAAGVLYFHVHNPLLAASRPLADEAIEAELHKQFKMKGLVLADPDVVRMMDNQLDTGHSDMLPVALKKDGSFYSSAKVATAEQFMHLRQYVRTLMREIGTEITAGDVTIAPYWRRKRTACTYCSFKPVCQFDTLIEPGEYNVLRDPGHDVMWSEMERRGER